MNDEKFDLPSENSEIDREEREVNTYDSPLEPLSSGEPSGVKKRNPWVGIYKLAATAMVVLTVIFSASDLFDLLISDTGTGNALFRRIFGSSTPDGKESFFELILQQSFGNTALSRVDQETSSPPSSEDSVPNGSDVQVPTESSPVATRPETTPLDTSSQPETSPYQPSSPTIPENAHPIVSMDMSLLHYGENYIYNNTTLAPDVSALAGSSLGSVPYSDGPLVLVIHTHGTEAFMAEGATYYTDEGELARSDDVNENMIAVGKEFVRVLEENGISTLHCTVMHDKESYRESYSRSAETIKSYLAKYPSIRYVFDLHRDSIMKSTEELVSAVTYIDGQRVAQIMPVAGSGYRGYEGNLAFALRLRQRLNGEYGTLSRPVCLRESQYNQSLAPVSLLLEIGTSGNTLDEAKRAARLTAETISEMITELFA